MDSKVVCLDFVIRTSRARHLQADSIGSSILICISWVLLCTVYSRIIIEVPLPAGDISCRVVGKLNLQGRYTRGGSGIEFSNDFAAPKQEYLPLIPIPVNILSVSTDEQVWYPIIVYIPCSSY